MSFSINALKSYVRNRALARSVVARSELVRLASKVDQIKTITTTQSRRINHSQKNALSTVNRTRENERNQKNGSKLRDAFIFFGFSIIAGNLAILCNQKLENRGAEEKKKANVRELCFVVLNNDVKALKELLKRYPQTDLNEKHPLGWTALLVATANGNIEMVRELLKRGADPKSVDDFSVSLERGNIRDVQEQYIQREREFSSLIYPSAPTLGFSPLHYACVSENIDMIKLLIEYGADPRVLDKQGNHPGRYVETDSENYTQIISLLEEASVKAEQEEARRNKENRRIFPLEKRLETVIVGQKAPIEAVASAIRRKENGWNEEERPLVFLFLGSSGVGKTELAKQVAKYLHSNEDSFIRIDMSEFQTKHEVSKFIGSPPGYVGHDEGGQLTEKLRKTPNAVVLLDEVEKAHPDVLNVMLQVFDEGRLTDGKGKTILCKDAIFIMTSNLAQREIAEQSQILREEAEKNEFTNPLKDDYNSPQKKFINQVIYPILRSHFRRDEFLGRITEILYFLPFNSQELHMIAEKEMVKWAEKASQRHQVKLTWSNDLIELIVKLGYNVHYGARSIKHEIDKRVINLIAKAHEYDEFENGASIHVYVENGKVNLNIDKTKGDKKKATGFLGF